VQESSDKPRGNASWLPCLFVASFLVLTLTAFFFSRVYFERPPLLNDAVGDILRIHLPNVQYSVNAIKSGELPLWNPNEFCGMPMFAGMEYGPLYPPNWSFLLLPLDVGHLLGALFHQVLLATGTYIFLLHVLRLRAGSALFGALCIGLSGWSTFRMLTEFDAYRSAAYIPWVLLFAARVFASPTHARCAVLAIAIALQFLAGEIEIWVRTLMLTGAFALFRIAQNVRVTRNAKSAVKPAIALAFAVLLAVGLVAVQLLPTLEASRLSLRSTEGLTFDHAFRGGIANAQSLLSMMAVYDYPAHGQFIGFLPLVLAAYALTKPKPATWFFLAFTAITFALILGDKTFVARIYYMLPTGNWFRAPIRFLPYMIFGIAVLAALGAQQFICDLEKTSGKLRKACAAIALLVLVAPALLSPIAASRVEFTAATACAVMLAALFAISLKRVMGEWHVRSVAVVLCGAYLALPITLYDLREFNIPKPLDFIGPAADALPVMRADMKPGERVYVDYAFETGRRQPKFGTVTGIPSINGISAYMPRTFWDFVYPYSSSRVHEYHKKEGYADMSVQSGLWGGLAFESGAQELFNILGVSRIGMGLGSELQYTENGDLPLPPELNTLYDISTGPLVNRFSAYNNSTAWPRAFIIEGDAPTTIEAFVAAYQSGSTPATIDKYDANYVRIRLPGKKGLLVFSDQFYPGWHARIDGAESDILPVAGVFRGLPVSEASRFIEFNYRPSSSIFGAIVTLLCLFIVVLLALPKALRTRRQSKSG